MGANEENMPDWIVNLVQSHSQIRCLLVPAYVDLDTHPERVRLFPSSAFLGSESSFLVFNINQPSGQLQLSNASEVSLPEELMDEPSIRPVLVDLSMNYLDEDHPLQCDHLVLYLDADSDVSLGRFRAVVFCFEDGRQLLLDPYWPLGIRFGGESDVVRMRGDFTDGRVTELEVSLAGST